MAGGRERRLVALDVEPVAGDSDATRGRCPACGAWAWSNLGATYGQRSQRTRVVTPFCEACGWAADDRLEE